MRRASPGGRQRASGEEQCEKKNNEKKTSKVTLAHFWLSVETEFPHFAQKAVKVLIPFTSTQGRTGHLCVLENHRTAGCQRAVDGRLGVLTAGTALYFLCF